MKTFGQCIEAKVAADLEHAAAHAAYTEAKKRLATAVAALAVARDELTAARAEYERTHPITQARQ